ncbi:MAG: hypothetical protein ISR65_13760 [Bacteriovoracaceae bacterium]|nr:hypothetical protein [Bacteriovoracaceae bacterium]
MSYFKNLFINRYEAPITFESNMVDLFEHFLRVDNVRGVENFLAWGRNPNLPVKSGVNPMVIAQINNNVQIIDALFKYGAQYTKKDLEQVCKAI